MGGRCGLPRPAARDYHKSAIRRGCIDVHNYGIAVGQSPPSHQGWRPQSDPHRPHGISKGSGLRRQAVQQRGAEDRACHGTAGFECQQRENHPAVGLQNVGHGSGVRTVFLTDVSRMWGAAKVPQNLQLPTVRL